MDHKRKLQKSQGPDTKWRLRIILCNLNFPKLHQPMVEVSSTIIAKTSLQLLRQDLQFSVRSHPQYKWESWGVSHRGLWKSTLLLICVFYQVSPGNHFVGLPSTDLQYMKDISPLHCLSSGHYYQYINAPLVPGQGWFSWQRGRTLVPPGLRFSIAI